MSFVAAALSMVTHVAVARSGDSFMRTTSTLLEICNSDNMLDEAYCRAYITGVADVALMQNKICIMGSIFGTDLRDAVVKFLRDKAPMRQYTAASVVTNILTHEYPCQTTRALHD
jgi:hypothetical protein